MTLRSRLRAGLSGGAPEQAQAQQQDQPPAVPFHGHPAINERITNTRNELEARVRELEEGLQEQRELSLRVAELSDFVAEMLGAWAREDRAGVEAVLAKHSHGG